MLKENIKVLVNKNGFGEAEYDSIHNLVKEYFVMYVMDKVNEFDSIEYRGHELIIHDTHGQLVEINNIEDIKEVIGYEL
jgi:hypothetical protein